MGCGDFGGTSLGETALCLMPEGHNYAGLITDNSGHAVEVTAVEGDTVTLSTSRSRFTVRGVSEESLRVTREMAGASLIDCFSRSDAADVNYTPLPSFYEGAPLSWTPADYRALTSTLPRSGMAYFCSNRENLGTVVLRSDSFYTGDLYTAANRFEGGDCGELDAAHCGAALRSARVALDMAPEEAEGESHFWELAGLGGVGVTFLFVGIFGHIFGHRYNARVDATEAAREAQFAAERAGRFAREAGTPEARRQAALAEESAREAVAARNAGRTREAQRQLERAIRAAEEAERIARERRDGPNDGDPPAAGTGGGGPVAPGGTPPPFSTTTLRVSDMARGILTLHGGGSPDPSAEGNTGLAGAEPPVLVPGALPLPVMTNPVAVPEPVVAPRPVVVPRLVPAL